jgi:hypothetical protein
LSIETDKKLQEISMENSREEKHFEDDDLADAVNEIGLMLGDGNNLRNNFADNQDDDGSDKSLEIPGSIETDLAKDIDRYCGSLKVVCVALKFDLEIFRILAMTQLDDIPGPNQIYSCDFCQPQPPIATLSELNEHLKSAHIDLVFHCETCDNYVDRNSLIQHMLGHLKEREPPNEPALEQSKDNDEVEDEAIAIESLKSDKRVNQPESEDDSIEHGEAGDYLIEDPVKLKNHMKKASGSNVKFLKKCHYCPKLFSNRSGRVYHQDQAHFNRRRFRCDQCDLSFGLKVEFGLSFH